MTVIELHPARTTEARRPAAYSLPPLPYDPAALEPYMSAETLRIHHDKHHAAYVAGANRVLEQIDSARATGEWSTINQLESDLAFHVSGHVLHSIFWNNLCPAGTGHPAGALAVAIVDDFGSFETFRDQFSRTAASLQGSGWAALAYEPISGRLIIEQIHDHQSSIAQGSNLLLVCDVWEHAYYLQYRNMRADWIAGFWPLVNWLDVAQRFHATNHLHSFVSMPFS